MWSVEYVQIPDISNSKRSSASNIGQLPDDLAVKVTMSDNEDNSDNESNSSDSAVGGSRGSSPARGSMDQRMSDSSPDGLPEADVLSPDSGKQTGTPGTSQEGSPADNIAQGGNTGHPGGPWQLSPHQRRIPGGKRSPDGSSSHPDASSSNLANNNDVCNSNYMNERTREQQSGSNASSQFGSSDYEGSQDGSRSLSLSSSAPESGSVHPIGGLDLKTPSPLMRGEYVLVTENDLANLPDELKQKGLSAAHRNKLKPGKHRLHWVKFCRPLHP